MTRSAFDADSDTTITNSTIVDGALRLHRRGGNEKQKLSKPQPPKNSDNNETRNIAARKLTKMVGVVKGEITSVMRKADSSRTFERGQLRFDENADEVIEFEKEDPPAKVGLLRKKSGKLKRRKRSNW